MLEKIAVVSRDSIAPIHSVEQGGVEHHLGELRDFRWSDVLRGFLPDASRLSISWVGLGPGETLAPHVHPIQSMMIFYGGSGRTLGELQGEVQEGDTVVVPAGCQHGFVAGPEGLQALSVQFGPGLYTSPERPRVMFADEEHTLETLLAYNRRRLEAFSELPIFRLLADGTLDDPAARARYLDGLQIWVNGNQKLLFTRQASCRDPAFEGVFLAHMHDEMGHDAMHADRADPEARPAAAVAWDPLMDAITTWFTHQMVVLDNAEKAAIIHLVIENASAAYHRHAMPVLGKYVNLQYFAVHVEADAAHAALGEELLRDQSGRTYERLRRIIGQAWDMLGAMTDRVVELTRGPRR